MAPPNFTKYSDDELLESLNSIDREKFPDNYKLLSKEINLRGYSIADFVNKTRGKLEDAEIKEWRDRSGIEPGYLDKEGIYTPNKVSLGTRLYSAIVSIGLVAYGIYGVIRNDLYIPGKHARGVHLHDLSTILCFIAFLLFGITLVSSIVDHYDKRNNEKAYFRFQKKVASFAIVFLALAIFREIFFGK